MTTNWFYRTIRLNKLILKEKIMLHIVTSGQSGVGQFEEICSKCNCHFSFSKSDTYPHTSDDYGGGRSTTNYVNCPECKHSNPVDGVMNPNHNNGIFGAVSKDIVKNKILSNVNVQALRNTTNDSDFKKLLIKFLS